MIVKLYHNHDDELIELEYSSRLVDVSDKEVFPEYKCPECKEVVNIQILF